MRFVVVLLVACNGPGTTVVDVHVTAAGADVQGAVVALTTTASVDGAADITDDTGLAQPVLYGDAVDLAGFVVTASKPGFDPVQVPAHDGLIEIALGAP